MPISRRELLTAGAASIVIGLPDRAESESTGASDSLHQAGAAALERKRTSHSPNLPIREYLVREARRITDNALGDLKTAGEIKGLIADRRRQYLDMMGLADLAAADARPPVPYKITGVVERPAYRIEKLHYESLPNLHVTANLYVPTASTGRGRRPAVLYVCGHAPQQKVH